MRCKAVDSGAMSHGRLVHYSFGAAAEKARPSFDLRRDFETERGRCEDDLSDLEAAKHVGDVFVELDRE